MLSGRATSRNLAGETLARAGVRVVRIGRADGRGRRRAGVAVADRSAAARHRALAADGVYDAAIAAARDLAVAPAQLPEATRQIGITPLPIEDADALSFGRDANPVRRIGVPRELASPEQREALAERYAREADRAAAQKTATSVDVTRETALAWLECYYVEQMTRIAGEELKAAQDELEGAESMYWPDG